MKKDNSIFDFIFPFIPLILGIILACSYKKNYSLQNLGGEFIFLSIALILIFFSNGKKISIPINFKNLNLKIVLYVFIISLVDLISVLCIVYIFKFAKIGDTSIIDSTQSIDFFSLIYIVIIAPIAEELFFRLWFLNLLLKKLNKDIAIITQGLIFAFVHCCSLNSVTFYIIIVGGIAYGYIFYYTKSILYSTICHASYNFLSIFFSFMICKKSILILLICILLTIICITTIVYMIKKIKIISLSLNA